MKIKLSTILLFVLFSSFSFYGFSQKNFKPGFVLLTEKDTLFGEIDYQKNELLSNKCRFRDEKKNIQVFNPEEILGFRFSGGKYYISRKVKENKVFLEYLIKGKVNIFMTQKGNVKEYFIDKEGEEINRIPFEVRTKYEGNTLMQYQTTKHVGFLNFYMSDAPEIASKIQSINKPDETNLIKLARDYHNVVCKTEECIVFEKRLPLLNVLPEIVVGNQNFVDVADWQNQKDIFTVERRSMVQSVGLFYGILTHIWLPRSNENFYLKTGLIYQKTKTSFEAQTVYKIPLQLEYLYPAKFIKPRLAVGVCIYKPNRFISTKYSAGLNIKLTKKSGLSVNYDFEGIPNSVFALLPSYKLSDNYSMGFSYKF